MEAELFGVEAGEGRARRVGALEEAHGGSLYIDEVADLPREVQARVLRVLVDQNYVVSKKHIPQYLFLNPTRELIQNQSKKKRVQR